MGALYLMMINLGIKPNKAYAFIEDHPTTHDNQLTKIVNKRDSIIKGNPSPLAQGADTSEQGL